MATMEGEKYHSRFYSGNSFSVLFLNKKGHLLHHHPAPGHSVGLSYIRKPLPPPTLANQSGIALFFIALYSVSHREKYFFESHTLLQS